MTLEPQQQQIDPKLIAQYVTQYLSADDNFMKFQIDSTSEFEMLRNDLLGLEYNEEKEQYVKSPYKKQLINEVGLNAVFALLRNRISKITSLSDLDDDDITNITLAYADDLTFLLAKHKLEYEIKSYQIASSIIGLCDDLFFTTLKKARNAGERDSLRKNFSFVESSENVKQRIDRPRNNGFFSNPLAGRGG